MKKIPYGISDFKSLIEENYYYVDKTMYLEKLEEVDKKPVYLKPRRFGKTLFTSMMYYYYDIGSIDLFDTLFKDTYVYTNPTPNKNNYYILKLDFSGMSSSESDNIDDIKQKFNECLLTGISQFLIHYGFEYSSIMDIDPADVLKRFLSFYDSLRLDKKLYIIIDEYDNYTNSILQGNAELFLDVVGKNGFIKAFYAVIKSMLGTIIDRVFITGVCSISLDSMTSGFNVAKNITTDEDFNSMTALTHEEVNTLIKEIIPEYKEDEVYNEMVENYDGYRFHGACETVFNPDLVMYYLSHYQRKEHAPEDLMDSNIISNYTQIKDIVKLYKNIDYKEVMKEIYSKNSIISKLKVNFDLNEDYEMTKDDIISLLFYFGYLTMGDLSPSLSLTFRIPNTVIKKIYNEYYLAIFKEDNIIISSDELESSIEDIMNKGDITSYIKYMSTVLKHANNQIYKTFREKDLQILLYATLDQYKVFKTEMEYPSNDNYIDIMILKNEYSKYDIMIELKYIKRSDYTERLLEEKMTEAEKQIKKYSEDTRIPENTRKFAVIFVGSECHLKEIN